MNDDVVKIFNQVRDISYRIPLSVSEEDDCCSGKHRLLKAQLEAGGYEVQWQVCSFKWSQMNLPDMVLSVPHEDDSSHVYLRMKIGLEWIDLDATWDSKLAGVFSVNEWDGASSTSVAVPEIEKFSLERSSQIMDCEDTRETEKDLKINGQFYKAFNEWLECARRLSM